MNSRNYIFVNIMRNMFWSLNLRVYALATSVYFKKTKHTHNYSRKGKKIVATCCYVQEDVKRNNLGFDRLDGVESRSQH